MKKTPEVIRVDQYPYVNFIRGSAYNNVKNGEDAASVYARYHRQLDEFVERRKPIMEQQEQVCSFLYKSLNTKFSF